MRDKTPILIVEDEALVALELAMTVEDVNGVLVGPVSTVAEALALIEIVPVCGAVLDANLADRDVTPLALALIDRQIPFVVYTGTGLPVELARQHPDLVVLRKPAAATIVIDALARMIDRPVRGRQPIFPRQSSLIC